MIRWLPALLAGVAVSVLLPGAGCQKSASESEDGKGAETGKPSTLEDVLKRMAQAYKEAPSYSDEALIHVVIDSPKKKPDQPLEFDYSVSLVRPNKIRVASYQGLLVSDGKQWHAGVQGLPTQVVQREAPAEVALKHISADQFLIQAMSPQFFALPPQLVLLLAEDPIKVLFEKAKVTLEQPGKIEDRDCYQVRVVWQDQAPDQPAIFWIDQETFLIREITLPTGALRQMLEMEFGQINGISAKAKFVGAKTGGEIDAKVFQFPEIKQEVEKVRFFLPPDPAQLLGQQAPDFKFVDLQGKPVTRESLAGKVALLGFWGATWAEQCRAPMAAVEKVYQKYKDNGKVAILAVSVDPEEIKNDALEAAAKSIELSLPPVRDPDQFASKKFRVQQIPVTLLLGPDGRVQFREMALTESFGAALPQKIDKLLAGEDTYQEQLANYQQTRKMLEDSAEGRLPDAKPEQDAAAEKPEGTQTKVEIPHAKIAPPSEPKTLRLKSLWKCMEVKAPGNVLVVPGKDGTPRIYVVSQSKTIAEIGTDGKVIARHEPNLEPYGDTAELICSLRTAVGGDGKRAFAAFGPLQQRVHVFDENWKPLSRFPETALINRHSGIADVQLGDLDGDGKIKIYVGYWGVVGVHAASLEGKRLLGNRMIQNVQSMAIGPADKDGRRELFCRREPGSLAVLDYKFDTRDTITISGQFLGTFVAADLKGDGKPLWCGTAPYQVGRLAAVGFTLKGEMLWVYPLPLGMHQRPIEPIVAGRITADGPGQWILPGSDGSIHVLSAEGKRIDEFNYGATLSGLAVAELDGKPALIVASDGSLEALRVEQVN